MGKVYWGDYHKEEKVGIWKNVPSQIAQWRPIIEKVTSSFHVPIPNHSGIHVSPAKTIACIIRIESNGNPNAVNSESGATGLCQIMPFHFQPGQDPKDPEWNVRKGLSILNTNLATTAIGNFQKALFYYGGRANRPWEPFIAGYWAKFVKHYKQFWGIDLEPGSKPNRIIQEALLEIARAKAKIGGIPYLVKEAEDGLEAAIKTLSGEDA